MNAGNNLYEDEGFFGLAPSIGPLKDRFVQPPFSVWNTRDGNWQARRRLWLARGIKSELGRLFKPTFPMPDTFRDGRQCKRIPSDISVFDPVICELAYRWWCPPGGVVLDPFAGGSVRGVVASLLGYKYLGIELRAEQVEANCGQINKHTRGRFAPKWRCGDSYELLPKAPACDFLFTCPPYGDFETYSDMPGDISNMTYGAFLDRYRDIIATGVGKLRQDRFACFVVGNYRAKADGRFMRDLVGDTVRAFESAGASFYNDIVLINAIGSGAVRVGTSFIRGARKVVKLHQNVLVFCKGDPRAAAMAIPVGP